MAEAVGGGKTPEECFNRWQSQTGHQALPDSIYVQGGECNLEVGGYDDGLPAASHKQYSVPNYPYQNYSSWLTESARVTVLVLPLTLINHSVPRLEVPSPPCYLAVTASQYLSIPYLGPRNR